MPDIGESLWIGGDLVGWLAVLVITLFIPALAIFLRTHIARKKQDRLGKTEQHYSLKTTEAYRHAVGTVSESPLSHYLVSLLILTVIIGWNAYLLIFGGRLSFEAPNFILAGGRIGNLAEADLIAYQTKTFMVITMAFLGAYIWSIQMTFRRIVTLDLSPATFQSISVRVLVATMVAAVIRHVYEMGGPDLDGAVLVILGFGCGIFPQMAIGYLKESVKTVLRGRTREAEALPLALIEGISVFDRVRLAELGIEDAQNLAHANPVEVFIRTPYQLELVMDWIAQAQALVFLMSANFTKLRGKFLIRTIFQLHDSLSSDDSLGEIGSELEVPRPVLENLRVTLERQPGFVRLVELRDRMVAAP